MTEIHSLCGRGRGAGRRWSFWASVGLILAVFFPPGAGGVWVASAGVQPAVVDSRLLAPRAGIGKNLPAVRLAPGMPVGANSEVQPTNSWCDFYGLNTTLNGQPVAVGAVISAYAPGDLLVGQHTVNKPGQYGVMHVYGDDSMTPAVDGAREGQAISFYINGVPATANGPDPASWTYQGRRQVDLSATSPIIDPPPPVSMLPLDPYVGAVSFPVSWSVPGGSTGTASYDVQYREGAPGEWASLLASAPLTSTLFSGQDGRSYNFRARAITANGSGGEWSAAVSTTVDLTPPFGSVSINGGGVYANSLSATLSLTATDILSGVWTMAFSNDGSEWSEWQGYSSIKTWTLAAGPEGLRTVYVRYRDGAQNVSTRYSSGITVDSSAPTGAVAINGGASDTNSTAVNLALFASDSLSGVSAMQFRNDGQAYTGWETYEAARAWEIPGGNGAKTVYVRFRDNAGNVSAPASAGITLNTTLPSSAVLPLGAYQSSATFTVSWAGSASGNGLDSFDLQYRDGAQGVWTDWVSGAPAVTKSAGFTGSNGHTYYFRSLARDMASNLEPYPGGDGDTWTTVDLSPPGSLGTAPPIVSINGGALDTPAANVSLSLQAADAGSGIAEVSFSNDGVVWSQWESYGSAKPLTLPGGDGTRTVWARFKDGAGNVSSPVSDAIRLDTSLAAVNRVSINDGAAYSNQVTVTLSLSASPFTSRMMIGNDAGFSGAAWEPYASYRVWALTQRGAYADPRAVYVRYKDVDGNITAVYQDAVSIDVSSPAGSVSIEGATAASRVRSAGSAVTLRLSARDGESGIAGMLLGNSPSFAGASWERYATSKPWSLGSSDRVYVTFKDNAGNASPVYTASLSGAGKTLPPVILRTIYPRTGGMLASSDSGVTIEFLPDAVGGKTDVMLALALAPGEGTGTGTLRGISRFLSLTAASGGAPVATLTRPYTLTVNYTAAEAVGVKESSLGIYWWSGTAWLWEPTSRVDTAARTVIATVDHMSSFAALGEGSWRLSLPVLVKSLGAPW